MRFLSMMTVAVVALLNSSAAVSAAKHQHSELLAEQILQQRFSNYVKAHGKTYEVEEFFNRFNVYKQNVAEIEAHNAKKGMTWTAGENRFTDMTEEERMATLQYKTVTGDHLLGASIYKSPSNSTLGDVPSYWDWREHGAVTSVKDQGQCGSCYSFGSSAAVEGAWAIAGKGLIDLSEQQIVDCSGEGGCNGGGNEVSFAYVQNAGLCSYNDYPYVAAAGGCRSCNPAAHISGYSVVSGGEGGMISAIQGRPLAVGVAVSNDWFNYKGGIYDGTCADARNHAVLVVGYGWDQPSNNDFWIIKNSWGAGYGAGGYIYIRRSVDKCQVGEDASFPTV